MAHVVATGLRTPVGLTAASSAAAARAGICRVREHPLLADPTGQPLRGAYDAILDPELLGWQRMLALAESGMGQILTILRSQVAQRGGSLFLALPEARPGFDEPARLSMLGGLKRFLLRERLALDVRPLSGGHVGGIDALRLGRQAIQRGDSDLVIVGGVDSYLDAETIHWLGERRQLATRATRSSFFPGEGAGFIVLMNDRLARAASLTPAGWIRGAAVSQEPTLKDAPTWLLGAHLAAAIELAASEVDPATEPIRQVLSDANGERRRSEAWGFAILRRPRSSWGTLDYESPAGCWGDLGAATGVALTALAIHDRRNETCSGLSLLVAGSMGGYQGAALIQQRGGF